jgi:hypothetical protein
MMIKEAHIWRMMSNSLWVSRYVCRMCIIPVCVLDEMYTSCNLLLRDVGCITACCNCIVSSIFLLAYAHFGNQQRALWWHHLQCATVPTPYHLCYIVRGSRHDNHTFHGIHTWDALCKSQTTVLTRDCSSVLFMSHDHYVILITYLWLPCASYLFLLFHVV